MTDVSFNTSATSTSFTSTGGGGSGGGIGASSTTSKNITVSRKAAKLMDVAVNEDVREALAQLPATGYSPTDPNPKQRKQLKQSLEYRTLQLHETFLEQFRVVRASYEAVAQEVETVRECTDVLDAALSEDRESREALLSSVILLREELQAAKKKEEQVKQFMEQYQLTPEEHAALKGEVSPAFVAALVKAKSIHDSCRNLLSIDHQQAAVEVMETMYITQMTAAEKLLRHLLPLTSEVLCQDVPQVTQFYVDAVQAIRDKPSQWSKVIHEVSRVRRIAVLRRFYDASSGASDGSKAPTAPQHAARFLSDLLAWLHQCIAEEADVLSVFFPDEGPREQQQAASDPTVDGGVQSLGITKAVVLDQIFEGLSKHLSEKIDGTIEAISTLHPSKGTEAKPCALLVLFKVESLLRFYTETTSRLLGERAALSNVLQTRRLNCLKVFFDTLKNVVATMLLPGSVGPDFAAPSTVLDVLQALRAMMDSLQSSTIPHSEREMEFAPVLGAVTDVLPSRAEELFKSEDPVTGGTFGSSTSHQGIEGPNIFKVNLFSLVKTTLAPYSFTASRQQKIDEHLVNGQKKYVQQVVTALFTQLGFQDALSSVEHGTTSPIALRSALHSFYSRLYEGGGLSIPMLENIQSFHIREGLRRAVTEEVCKAYESIYGMAMKDAATAADSIILKNTPDQIRVLLEAKGDTVE